MHETKAWKGHDHGPGVIASKRQVQSKQRLNLVQHQGHFYLTSQFGLSQVVENPMGGITLKLRGQEIFSVEK